VTLQKGHHGLPCQKVHPPRAAAPSPSAATLFPRPATRHRHTSGEARVTPRDQRKRVPHAPHGQMSARHATSGSGARSDRRRGAPIRLYVAGHRLMTSPDRRASRISILSSGVSGSLCQLWDVANSTPLHLQRAVSL